MQRGQRKRKKRKGNRRFGWLIVLSLLASLAAGAWLLPLKNPSADSRFAFARAFLAGLLTAPTNPDTSASSIATSLVTNFPIPVPPRTSAPPVIAPASPAPRPMPTPTPDVPSAPPSTPNPLPWREVFDAQLALARRAISPGSLDGVVGSQTRAALRAFQANAGLPVTGGLDAATAERLRPEEPVFTRFVVTAADLARLQPLGATWLAKSQQSALDYETLLELVAEKTQSHPDLIRQLNADLAWNTVAPGTALTVPHVQVPPATSKAAYVRIFLSQRLLQAFDPAGHLLAHFPCSIARLVEKRPIGELAVAVIIPDPNYTFDPAVFPESAEGRALDRKLVLQPGPNNPVGTVWIGLNQPRYGIHGTPSPEKVGRTESHGCFRLANWNAEYLLTLAWVGMPVHVEP